MYVMAFSSSSEAVMSAWILNTSNALILGSSIFIADEISSVKAAKMCTFLFFWMVQWLHWYLYQLHCYVDGFLVAIPIFPSRSARSSHVASYITLHFLTFLNCWLTETVSLVLLCKQGGEITQNVKTCSHAPKHWPIIVETE